MCLCMFTCVSVCLWRSFSLSNLPGHQHLLKMSAVWKSICFRHFSTVCQIKQDSRWEHTGSSQSQIALHTDSPWCSWTTTTTKKTRLLPCWEPKHLYLMPHSISGFSSSLCHWYKCSLRVNVKGQKCASRIHKVYIVCVHTRMYVSVCGFSAVYQLGRSPWHRIEATGKYPMAAVFPLTSPWCTQTHTHTYSLSLTHTYIYTFICTHTHK